MLFSWDFGPCIQSNSESNTMYLQQLQGSFLALLFLTFIPSLSHSLNTPIFEKNNHEVWFWQSVIILNEEVCFRRTWNGLQSRKKQAQPQSEPPPFIIYKLTPCHQALWQTFLNISLSGISLHSWLYQVQFLILLWVLLAH